MARLKIVFMGTPEFAIAIFNELMIESQVQIVGVITAPDRKAGRGRKVRASPVKERALIDSIRLFQPNNLKDDDFIRNLKLLNADLFVVVAFRMLPEVVWSIPRLGTINLHASLLPQYRGAAPINWAIINGETETGVTTFYISKEIDTGHIIEQRKISIGSNENVGELHDRLMRLGASTTRSTVLLIKNKSVSSVDQNNLIGEKELKPAPKMYKEDCRINFNSPVIDVHNFCRGLDPYPGAWSELVHNVTNEVRTFKFFQTEITTIKINEKGHNKSNNEEILIPCGDYYLKVKQIQPEGKRRMSSQEFLIGNSFHHYH